MESKFGWLLSGPVNHNSDVTMNQISCYSITATEVDDETLDEKLQKFWEVNAYEYDEVKADDVMKELKKNVRFDSSEGKYIVPFPRNPRNIGVTLPRNLGMCKSR